MTKTHINGLFKDFLCRQEPAGELRRATEAYQKHILDTNKDDPRRFWRLLNNEFLKKCRYTNLRELIINRPISGSSLADEFNNFFMGFAPTGNSIEALTLTANTTTESIAFHPMDSKEMFLILMNFKCIRSADYDGHKIRPIIYVADIIAPCLAHTSLLTSKFFPPFFLLQLKIRKFQLFLREEIGTSYQTTNQYLFYQFFKCHRKVIIKKIENFYNKQSMLTNCQFGFR